ncbi:MAG: rRNA pseudouridine synthase [Chthonomonadales bacterium]|nr:rRNA pseudouridine synthase [Chthonomonadales bacterium]
MDQRVHKILADAGIASRRACESLIRAGRVTVNGEVVAQLGARADDETDDIRVDGKPIPKDVERQYLVVNKPIGYVATVRDRHAAHTVMELISGVRGRLYPVGRLDADSAGLLLMTNDGAFAQAMLHPSHGIERSYRAVVRGALDDFALTDLRAGVALEDGITAPADVTLIERDPERNISVVDIVLREGRNRQVRRMMEAVGSRVLALTRTRFGPIVLAGLAPGTWRKLRSAEIEELLTASRSVTNPGDG